MNTNPGGNTIITNALETTADANGDFERFEVILSGPAKTPKIDTDKQYERATGGS